MSDSIVDYLRHQYRMCCELGDMPPDLGFDEWVNSMSNMALLRLIDERLKGEMNCPRCAEGREVMSDNFQIMREKFDQKRREYETAENLRFHKENNEMRARIAELEAALEMFANIEAYIDSRDMQPVYAFTERMSKAARAALNGEK